MPKFLIKASYTPAGIKGVLDKGGTARRTAIEKTLADLGGALESFYFAFGDDDVYAICDLPDNVTAAAVGLRVSASGMAATKSVVLLTPEEIDRASSLSVSYSAPGS